MPNWLYSASCRPPGPCSPTPTAAPCSSCCSSARGRSASSSTQLGLTQPGTSKHLRVLREAGLVQVRQEAQRRVYALDPGPLAELDVWLAPYRRLWNDSLDALGRHLDRMPTEEE